MTIILNLVLNTLFYPFDYRQSLPQTPCSAEWTTHIHLCCLWAVMQNSLLWENPDSTYSISSRSLSGQFSLPLLSLQSHCPSDCMTCWNRLLSLPPFALDSVIQAALKHRSHTHTQQAESEISRKSWGFTDRYGSSPAKRMRMQPELQRRDVEEESRCHIICVWLRALRSQSRTEAGGGLLSNRGDWVYATLDRRWIAGKSIYKTMQNRRSST